MENQDELYSSFQEMLVLKKKLRALEEQKRFHATKQLNSEIDSKTAHLKNILTDVTGYLETIGNKKSTLKNLEQSGLSENNSIQLCHTHHNDFVNMLSSKHNLDKLIHQQDSNMRNNFSDIKSMLANVQNINSNWQNKLEEKIREYKISKGLLNNICELKKLDEVKEQKSDSDLGCNPHEGTSINVNATAMSQFATSSPISTNLIDI